MFWGLRVYDTLQVLENESDTLLADLHAQAAGIDHFALKQQSLCILDVTLRQGVELSGQSLGGELAVAFSKTLFCQLPATSADSAPDSDLNPNFTSISKTIFQSCIVQSMVA